MKGHKNLTKQNWKILKSRFQCQDFKVKYFNVKILKLKFECLDFKVMILPLNGYSLGNIPLWLRSQKEKYLSLVCYKFCEYRIYTTLIPLTSFSFPHRMYLFDEISWFRPHIFLMTANVFLINSKNVDAVIKNCLTLCQRGLSA